ncbi:hypothetical protein SAMN06265379_104172 [Saccharicrinis carchari]|uniref:Novel STAND NTPase 1 domain-containing protein n=1 Tax=Saccharicrinis carchari TaxID=1168039 RepID=A0A521D564_SACCC|nr:hypothetical protein [Saccharicrinis carchari]SMO66231.1 hypothetical protein SAMN06265379_104172 [Saccharicrinis carchari]
MKTKAMQNIPVRAVDSDHPYLGLSPFAEAHKDYFFGRDSDITELLHLVERNTITTLTGQSGLGKTSLIQAGLMPKLRKLDYFPIDLRFNFDIKGKSVVDSLKDEIIEKINSIDPSLPKFESQTLWEYFHSHKILDGYAIPVFIFDQFEELFTRGSSKDQSTQELITELTDFIENQTPLSYQNTTRNKAKSLDGKSQNYRVLISLREDYLPQLETLSRQIPSLKRSRFRIVQMNKKQALDAILKPGKNIIDEKEAKKILQLIQLKGKEVKATEASSLHQEKYEPFILSLVCDEINKKRLDNKLPKITNELLKNIKVADIMEEFYLQNIKSLSPEAQQLIEEKMLTADGHRKLQPIADLIDSELITEAEIRQLIDRRILRKEIWSDRDHVELIHDRLIHIIATRKKERQRKLDRKKRIKMAFMAVAGMIIVVAIPLIIIWEIKEDTQQLALEEKNIELKVTSASLRDEKQKADKQTEIAEAERNTAMILRKKAEELKQKADTQKIIAEENARLAKKRLEKIEAEQREEFKRTRGKFDTLQYLNGKNYLKEQFIAGAVNYLWWKGGAASTDTLISLLREYEAYIPDRYGLTFPSGKIELVQDQPEWPLTLCHHPDYFFYYQTFNFHWKTYAHELAESWGIPVPDKVKFITDNALNINQMIIKTPDVKGYHYKTLLKKGWTLISIANIKKDTRLKVFVKDRKKEWIPVNELTYGGPYYLAPKWTQPVFAVAGHYYTYPGEKGMAFLFANQLLDHPELLINHEVTRLLLAETYKKDSVTTFEALRARNGIEGVTKDLIEIVRSNHKLKFLPLYLDYLANYPKDSSQSAAKRAINHTLNPHMDNIELYGNKHAPITIHIPSDEPKHYVKTLNLQESAKNFKIRIYTAKNLNTHFYESYTYTLKPELVSTIDGIRSRLNQKFGFIVPPVKFHISETLAKNEVRIEILNQSASNPLASPVALNPDAIFSDLSQLLYNRAVLFRTYWITPQWTNDELLTNDTAYSQWLKNTYSVTDLKNILRSVLLAEQKENEFIDQREYDKAISAIPLENTIHQTNWMLKSLVFWFQTDFHPLDIHMVRKSLIKTQAARFDTTSLHSNNRISVWIKQGINNLNVNAIDQAEELFKKAVSRNPKEAEKIFLSMYPDNILYDIDNILSFKIRPGRIEDATLLYRSEVRDLELYINNSNYTDNPQKYRSALILLLNYYQQKSFYENTDELIDKLNKLPKNIGWSVQDEYLFAYLLLRNNVRYTSPKNISHIKKLFIKAIEEWPSDDISIMYKEVIDLIRQHFYGFKWSNELLIDLTNLYPDHYWVNYYMGYHLASQNNYEMIKLALAYLDKAEASIPGNITARKAWIDYHRGQAYYRLSFYTGKDDWKNNVDTGIRILKSLVANADNLPDNLNAISYLYNLYQQTNNTKAAEEILIIKSSGEKDTTGILRDQFMFYLTKKELSKASSIAERYPDDKPWYYFQLAMVKVLLNSPDAEYCCNKFIEEDHDYKDYILMLRYFHLMKNGKKEEAENKLNHRWASIDRTTWSNRLMDNDFKVFREMLIGYYLGHVDDKTLLEPLAKETAFEKHGFSNISSYQSLRCEAFFYAALYKYANGDIKACREYLDTVLSTKIGSFYEYHMAANLLDTLDPD